MVLELFRAPWNATWWFQYDAPMNWMWGKGIRKEPRMAHSLGPEWLEGWSCQYLSWKTGSGRHGHGREPSGAGWALLEPEGTVRHSGLGRAFLGGNDTIWHDGRGWVRWGLSTDMFENVDINGDLALTGTGGLDPCTSKGFCLFLFLELIFFFNGRIIALQCCVGFSHIIVWISHKYSGAPPSLCLAPTTHPIPPLWVVAKHWVELPASQQIPTGYLFDIWQCICFRVTQFIPPSPSSAAPTSPVSTSASLFLTCKQVHQYYFSRFHTYALTYNVCFPHLLHTV